MVTISATDGGRDSDDLGDTEDHRDEHEEVIKRELLEDVELRSEPSQHAEKHDNHEDDAGHIDRRVLCVLLESQLHCGGGRANNED